MDKTLDEMIRENLKFEIEHCGKKKREIAKAIGVTSPTVSQYCSGRVLPSVSTLSRLCTEIGVSADDILCVKRSDLN